MYLVVGGKLVFERERPINIRVFSVDIQGNLTLCGMNFLDAGIVRSAKWRCPKNRACC